jgi:hypothetical protein
MNALVAVLLVKLQFEKIEATPPKYTAPPSDPVSARALASKTQRTRGGVAHEGAVRKAGSATAYRDSTTRHYSDVSTRPLVSKNTTYSQCC